MFGNSVFQAFLCFYLKRLQHQFKYLVLMKVNCVTAKHFTSIALYVFQIHECVIEILQNSRICSQCAISAKIIIQGTVIRYFYVLSNIKSFEKHFKPVSGTDLTVNIGSLRYSVTSDIPYCAPNTIYKKLVSKDKNQVYLNF